MQKSQTCQVQTTLRPQRREMRSTLADGFLGHLVGRACLNDLFAERVRRVQSETLEPLPGVLLKLGVVSEEDLAVELAAFSGFPLVSRSEALRTAELVEIGITESFLRTHEFVPLSASDREVKVACWDALDEYAIRALDFASNRTIVLTVATRSQVQQALAASELSAGMRPDGMRPEATDDEEIDRLKDLASEAPVVRLVQHLIDEAVRQKASDMHLESSEAALHVRFRLDGLLRELEQHPKGLAPPVVSRIKVMAGLNIAERRLPQDGRIRVTVRGKDVDFRVATSPTLHGESVVLRILDRQDVALDFDALGFDAELKSHLRNAIARPHGIVLVTGPTGSGKTTTLYASLKEINTPDKKILTVEDPVEYVLTGINQVPIKPQIGLTFAGALRSFLRQDPDVMMVGEIRDRETADIAIQAALTGHLLLSTLHTNTAAAAITRLLDMGIDDYLLTSTLHLIIGQRLVRKLCERCREPYGPTSDARQRLGVDLNRKLTWYRPVGCPACQGGYKGRTTIIEALPMSDAVRAKVLARADAHQIEQVAISEGMRTMFAHGIERVHAGLTTAEEVLRVTNLG
jgi:general secretion pathway protein E